MSVSRKSSRGTSWILGRHTSWSQIITKIHRPSRASICTQNPKFDLNWPKIVDFTAKKSQRGLNPPAPLLFLFFKFVQPSWHQFSAGYFLPFLFLLRILLFRFFPVILRISPFLISGTFHVFFCPWQVKLQTQPYYKFLPNWHRTSFRMFVCLGCGLASAPLMIPPEFLSNYRKT